MTKPPISRFPAPRLADLPQDIRERIAAVQEKSGFVPNVFLALARRPDEFRAFFAYHEALMERPGGLSKAEREMIVVATSGLNQCQYCVVAHGAILRIRAKNPLLADQVAVNHRKADLSPRQKAMLDFAVKVAERSQAIEDADYENLKSHGFSDDDAWDIARSRRCSRCPTGSPTPSRSGRTTNFMRWGGTGGTEAPSAPGISRGTVWRGAGWSGSDDFERAAKGAPRGVTGIVRPHHGYGGWRDENSSPDRPLDCSPSRAWTNF